MKALSTMRKNKSKIASVSLRKGSFAKIDAANNADSLEGEENFRGRGRAKRDARAAKKINKAAQPTRKERKGIKSVSKAKLRGSKGKAKETKATSKKILAKQGIDSGAGNKAKVLDTINAVVDTAATVIKGKSGASESGSSEVSNLPAQESENKFSFTAWYMILAYILIVSIIIYLVTKKK